MYTLWLNNIAVNDSSQEMQKFIKAFAQNSEDIGLITNIFKTKCIATNKDNAHFKIRFYGKKFM